jgi:hypothetical protein
MLPILFPILSLGMLLPARPPHTQHGSPSLRMQLSERRAEVGVTLSKPLGMVLEEQESGSGVVVESLVEGGAAATSGAVRPGDWLVRVDGTDASKLGFDDVVELLSEAPDPLELTLSRLLPAKGDDSAPIDIAANLAKGIKPADAVQIDKVVREARRVLRERTASEQSLQAELGEFLRIETIVGAGVQRDGTVKVRFFGIFSTDGVFSSYSCNVSATGRVGADGAVTISALECAKDEGWGRTIGVIRAERR